LGRVGRPLLVGALLGVLVATAAVASRLDYVPYGDTAEYADCIATFLREGGFARLSCAAHPTPFWAAATSAAVSVMGAHPLGAAAPWLLGLGATLAAASHAWSLGAAQAVHQGVQRLLHDCRVDSGKAARRLEALELVRVDQRALHVHGHVQPDGPGATARGLPQRPFEVVPDTMRVVDDGRMFGEAVDVAHDVGLLVPELAERQPGGTDHRVPTHVPRENDHRKGVHPRAPHAGDGVGAPGATRDVDRGDAVGEPVVGLRGDGAGLLVVARHPAEALLAAHRVVEMHGPPPVTRKTSVMPWSARVRAM